MRITRLSNWIKQRERIECLTRKKTINLKKTTKTTMHCYVNQTHITESEKTLWFKKSAYPILIKVKSFAPKMHVSMNLVARHNFELAQNVEFSWESHWNIHSLGLFVMMIGVPLTLNISNLIDLYIDTITKFPKNMTTEVKSISIRLYECSEK